MNPLNLPSTKKEIETIQSRRKRVALEQAKRAPFYSGKLDHIDGDNLDDPAEWAKIPILDKEILRQIPPDEFEGSLRHLFAGPNRRVLAFGRRNRRADLLSKNLRGHALRLSAACQMLDLCRGRVRGSLPDVVSLRRSSGRSVVVPHRQLSRRGHNLGRCGQHNAIACPAGPDWPA